MRPAIGSYIGGRTRLDGRNACPRRPFVVGVEAVRRPSADRGRRESQLGSLCVSSLAGRQLPYSRPNRLLPILVANTRLTAYRDAAPDARFRPSPLRHKAEQIKMPDLASLQLVATGTRTLV